MAAGYGGSAVPPARNHRATAPSDDALAGTTPAGIATQHRRRTMNYTGSGGNDTMTGSSSSDTFYLKAGNDLAYGYGSSDTIAGQGGADKLYGGDSADMLYGGGGQGTPLGGSDGGDLYGGGGEQVPPGG